MKVAIIIPVGPGHEHYPKIYDAPVGGSVIYVPDHHGLLGRSKARNMGMEMAPKDTEWFFFLDADDELELGAYAKMQRAVLAAPKAKAIFGSISGWTSRGIRRLFYNSYPKSWDELVELDTESVFCISALFRAPEALEIGFKEDLDTTETLEFSMAFIAKHPWVKSRLVFSLCHTDRPSAGGPRGYDTLDWHAELRPLMAWGKKRGRIPLTSEERNVPGRYWL
jgi:glycosyltransferase involved in cell wall biosynthesis